MIILGTKLGVSDNSGALVVECMKILGGTKKKISYAGSIIVVAIKEAVPNSKVKKGSVCRALIVRTSYPIRRADGSYINFSDNAVVIVDKFGEPLGTRVLGPVAREVRDFGYLKIASLATEVL